MIPDRQGHVLASASPAPAAGAATVRHLHPLENERKGVKFAALDHDVARVLGPQRGAAVLYGFLASTWFEYADPSKLAERRKKFTPGDWVEASYGQFMEIGGTRSRDSVIRWLRILAEEAHPCPWSRCADEHPLIVVHRQGQSKPNRYRKWRCGEDALVTRRRVRSEKLQDAARRRVAAGQLLNGIEGSSPVTEIIAPAPDDQLPLLRDADQPKSLKSDHQTSENEPGVSSEVRSTDDRESAHQTPESPLDRLLEVRSTGGQKSDEQTSLRVKTLNTGTDSVECLSQNTAEKTAGAAAIEVVDEDEAVACEVVDAIIRLAQRLDPDYPQELAWTVARKLAAAALTVHDSDSEAARSALLLAIQDERLARAANPIGLLIRGIVGDKNGRDRYLLKSPMATANVTVAVSAAPTRYATSTRLPPGLHDALLEAIRAGTAVTPKWRSERGISEWAYDVARSEVQTEIEERGSSTPLAEEFEVADPVAFEVRMEAILAELPIVKTLGVEPNLEHPMLRGLCIAQLERELAAEYAAKTEPT